MDVAIILLTTIMIKIEITGVAPSMRTMKWRSVNMHFSIAKGKGWDEHEQEYPSYDIQLTLQIFFLKGVGV